MRRSPGWPRWASLAIGAALLARIPDSGLAVARDLALVVADARTFEFAYEVSLDAPRRGGGPINVFVPLAHSNEQQEILRAEIVTTVSGEERTENVYGNRFWHGRVGAADARAFHFAARYLVRRKGFRSPALHSGRIPDGAVPDKPASYGAAGMSGDSWNLARYLEPDERVPVSGPLVDAIRKAIRPAGGSKLARARAIYDYVIDNMEYKRVGTGWGNGDTYWACSARYGNCTDFHALFISLARAEGIPARFEIGFPIPEDRAEGAIAGYHCWVEFYLTGMGWIPVDAAEAWKRPARRDFYFGTQPPDRIGLTVGRDLELGEGHASGPLNYFVYPHVEDAGEKVAVRTRFGYRDARLVQGPDGRLAPGAR